MRRLAAWLLVAAVGLGLAAALATAVGNRVCCPIQPIGRQVTHRGSPHLPMRRIKAPQTLIQTPSRRMRRCCKGWSRARR